MGRRFPPPLFGIEETETRSKCFVDIVRSTEEPLDKDELIRHARTKLTKSDGEPYSKEYLRRIVETFVQVGVLRQAETGISVYEFAHEWRAGEMPFETFLWSAVKRSWVIDGEFPEGIEGLYDIHRIIKNASEPPSSSEIRDRLGSDYDYEFNVEGIRGYLPLLEALGAIHESQDGYETVAPDRFSERFRNADICWQFEQWLKREGANTSPPPTRVKRDLAKYVMYRESGGHGRHRTLLDTARNHYLDDSVLTDPSITELRRADTYVQHRQHRRQLRDRIVDRFDCLSARELAGLSTDVLERMAESATEREARRIKSGAGSGFSRAELEALAKKNRESYTFSSGFELYDWQREAAEEWFVNKRSEPESGIAKVVTGAGKTVMALEIIRRWREAHPDGVISVVVPTKVLMHQWLEELVETLGVPTNEIGWLGDGTKDGFEDGYTILVSIVNSAVKEGRLATSVEKVSAENHLLIADECHRYTGDTFSNIFDSPRTASLGLSATPLSTPGSDERSAEDEMLLEELGEIYYDLSYDEGLARALIPEFRINYVGFELTNAEQTAYDRLTDAVVDAVSDIEQRYQNRLYELDGNFARKLQVIKEAADTPTPAITDYFEYTQKRRELIADAVARQAITLELLQRVVERDQKAIVFQERIEQLEQMIAPTEKRGRDSKTGDIVDTDIERANLYDQYPNLEQVDRRLEDLFFKASYRPVMYHSKVQSGAWNDFAIEWFDDDGFANVMLSVKALVEGVDVPSADVGIVRVSSGSVRQRIQTLGRVLRTGDDPDRRSELYVLYAMDTVDADIFDRYDWRAELSRADVRHLVWDTEDDVIEGSLRQASDDEIPSPPPETTVPETADLERGDTYTGPRRGFEFSVTADGDPFRATGDGRRFIQNQDYRDVAAFVRREKGGGTVRVNEHNHAITYLDDRLVFVDEVSDPEDITYETDESGSLTDEPDFSLDEL